MKKRKIKFDNSFLKKIINEEITKTLNEVASLAGGGVRGGLATGLRIGLARVGTRVWQYRSYNPLRHLVQGSSKNIAMKTGGQYIDGVLMGPTGQKVMVASFDSLDDAARMAGAGSADELIKKTVQATTSKADDIGSKTVATSAEKTITVGKKEISKQAAKLLDEELGVIVQETENAINNAVLTKSAEWWNGVLEVAEDAAETAVRAADDTLQQVKQQGVDDVAAATKEFNKLKKDVLKKSAKKLQTATDALNAAKDAIKQVPQLEKDLISVLKQAGVKSIDELAEKVDNLVILADKSQAIVQLADARAFTQTMKNLTQAVKAANKVVKKLEAKQIKKIEGLQKTLDDAVTAAEVAVRQADEALGSAKAGAETVSKAATQTRSALDDLLKNHPQVMEDLGLQIGKAMDEYLQLLFRQSGETGIWLAKETPEQMLANPTVKKIIDKYILKFVNNNSTNTSVRTLSEIGVGANSANPLRIIFTQTIDTGVGVAVKQANSSYDNLLQKALNQSSSYADEAAAPTLAVKNGIVSIGKATGDNAASVLKNALTGAARGVPVQAPVKGVKGATGQIVIGKNVLQSTFIQVIGTAFTQGFKGGVLGNKIAMELSKDGFVRKLFTAVRNNPGFKQKVRAGAKITALEFERLSEASLMSALRNVTGNRTRAAKGAILKYVTVATAASGEAAGTATLVTAGAGSFTYLIGHFLFDAPGNPLDWWSNKENQDQGYGGPDGTGVADQVATNLVNLAPEGSLNKMKQGAAGAAALSGKGGEPSIGTTNKRTVSISKDEFTRVKSIGGFGLAEDASKNIQRIIDVTENGTVVDKILFVFAKNDVDQWTAKYYRSDNATFDTSQIDEYSEYDYTNSGRDQLMEEVFGEKQNYSQLDPFKIIFKNSNNEIVKSFSSAEIVEWKVK